MAIYTFKNRGILKNLFAVALMFSSFHFHFQARADESPKLGKIEFPNSGAPRAQKDFIEGVLLLHSFSYDDAAEAFKKAQTLDPSFALAYWGEAMTYCHPVWGEYDIPSAKKALNRLAPTPQERLAKAPTQREKDYLTAFELILGEGDQKTRLRLHSEAMDKLYRKYETDLEAKAFFVLATLGKSEGNREETTYMKGAGLALEILDINPEHPGALHYFIHSVDDPVHAPLGLVAARKLENVAASVGHAVHMAAHIYGPLGMWKEALASNQKSWAIGEARVKNKHLGSDQRDFHDLTIFGRIPPPRFVRIRRGMNASPGFLCIS